MNNKIIYLKIGCVDYEILTNIMTSAFNEDTSIHTDFNEDGPRGYNDGSLIKRLNENEAFQSYKIVYQNNIVGAYTVAIKYDNEYTLEMLFIDPQYRKNHLGSIVWKDIEEKYTDAKKWTVETPDYSKRNHHFYTKKCGFTFQRENTGDNGAKSFIFEKFIDSMKIITMESKVREQYKTVENMFPKRLARTIIYENPWVNLYVDKVIFAGGRLIEKHHYLHYDRQSVGIVIENNEDEILLIKSYRYVTSSIEWEIPAGRIEEGETPQEAGKREVLEETGYTVTEPRLICTFNPSNGMSDAVFNIVKCKSISSVGDFDKNEVKELKWVTISNIKEMIGKNQIKCGPSLIGLLLTLSGIEEVKSDI